MLQAKDWPEAWTLIAVAVAMAQGAIDRAMLEAIDADAAFMWWWPVEGKVYA